MTKDSSYTAMYRNGPSAPGKWLLENKKLNGRTLDYGCGRNGGDGFQLGMHCYDKYHSPEMPRGKFDVILCTYVLNVVPPLEQAEIMFDVLERLKRLGKAYFTVRSDVKKKTATQWVVRLDPEKIVRKGSGYITYVYSKCEV